MADTMRIRYLAAYFPKELRKDADGLRLANERRRYKVTPSLIGWAQPLGVFRESIGWTEF